jgi:putative transposase
MPPSRAALEDDAMKNDSKNTELREAFGPDTIEQYMREQVRDKLGQIIAEEVMLALGADRYERVGEERRGYLHGTRRRTLTTSLGPTELDMPRARLKTEDGGTTEWSSRIVPRYQRRTQRIDEAILGVYLSGGNTRRIRGALAPLLKGGPLSKDAVSRLVGRLSEEFNAWRERDLSNEEIRYIFLDGWYPKVRIGKKRERVPVLVVLGVQADGHRVLLDMCIAGEESCASWSELVDRLEQRHMNAPLLAVIDGNSGLQAALSKQWPTIEIQRCTAHKLRNLQSKAPVRMQEELAEDYRRMIYADNRQAVEQQRQRFIKKWKLLCPAVVDSFNEAGDQLFTFLKFPSSQWQALRTTNVLERINGEFRRRTKTQSSLPNAKAVLLLLFGLLKSGQISLRNKMGGAQDMAKVSSPLKEKSAAVPA